MNYSAIIFSLFAFAGCVNQSREQKPVKVVTHASTEDEQREIIQPEFCDTILLGDLNSDQQADTAFVTTPPTIAAVDKGGNIIYEMGCEHGDCYNRIRFSCHLPELVFENSVWGIVDNAGDLNNDGYSEIIFLPNWFTSNMGLLYLYSLKNGKWEKITEVTYRRNDEEAPLKTHIVKQKGKYYLRGVKHDGEDTPYQIEINLH